MARRLSLPKKTIQRALYFLVDSGFVCQVPSGFQLSGKAVRLGSSVDVQPASVLRTLLLPCLVDFHQATGAPRGVGVERQRVCPLRREGARLETAFFGAGTETAAAALAWALHLLDRHPEVAQRMHAEVTTVLAGGPARFEHLPRLELTSRVITETLRLYPPGWIFTRTVSGDTRLGGDEIPAGTTVIYSPYLLHRRPDLYDRPEVFDPDRWDPRRPQPDREAFVPFGAGARKCIGDRFALTEITLTLATIMSRWSLHSVDGHRVRPRLGVALMPKGLRMRAAARALAELETA